MKTLRLQQILSRAGIASRRSAEALITSGRVRVNGEVVTTLGARAHPVEDVITVDGNRVGQAQEAATIMLHKPAGVVTTLADPKSRETVADLVASEPFRFVPVGRLDYHSEGLLLLSTDGELVNRLLHPSFHVPKIYHVKVRGRLSPEALDRLRDGVKLDDGPTRPTVVEVLEASDRHTWIEIVVTEGRNRLVRRMLDTVRAPALRLIRTEMATLELGELKPGQYRYLSPGELDALYRTAGLPAARPSERGRELGPVVLGKARRGRGPRPGQPAKALPEPSSSAPSPEASKAGSRQSARRASPRARGPREAGRAGPRGSARGRSSPGRRHAPRRPR